MGKDLDFVRKILVLRYRSIGDILLANPALAGLRHRFGQAEIGIVVDDVFEEILHGNPNVDTVITHTRNPKGAKWKEDLNTIRKVRAGRFDMVVDLQSGPRGAWTALFSGAGLRVGHAYQIRNRICYNIIGEKPAPEDHTWKVQFKTIRPLGVEWPEKPEFHLSFPEESSVSVRARLDKAGLMFDRPLALLHPGARIQEKRWPASKMGRLAKWLVDEKNFAVVLAGSAVDESEIKTIRRASGYALPYFTNLSLGELAALIKMSALIVCNDSGPMHMAGVLDTPVVALFGPSDPILWEPVGERKIILTCSPPMECMPCYQKGCPYKGDHCMTRIEVDEVKRAIGRLLAPGEKRGQRTLL